MPLNSMPRVILVFAFTCVLTVIDILFNVLITAVAVALALDFVVQHVGMFYSLFCLSNPFANVTVLSRP